MSKLLNSNRIGITDITNRLEHEIYTHVKQELNWQAKVMLNNFREKLNEVEADEGLSKFGIFSELVRFLDEEEERLNENSVNE